MKSTIGLKSLVAWPLLTDPEGGPATYGTAMLLAGAIEATITPETSEPNVQYADDVEYDSLAPDTPYNIEMDVSGMSIEHQAKLQGHTIDNKGGMIIKDGDDPPYIALAFRALKSGGGYRYVVIYKGKPQFMTRTYRTKEGTTVTRQTTKMAMKGISRISDGLKQYVVDTEIANFFTTPYTPVVTP